MQRLEVGGFQTACRNSMCKGPEMQIYLMCDRDLGHVNWEVGDEVGETGMPDCIEVCGPWKKMEGIGRVLHRWVTWSDLPFSKTTLWLWRMDRRKAKHGGRKPAGRLLQEYSERWWFGFTVGVKGNRNQRPFQAPCGMVVTFSWEKAKVDHRGRILQERVGLANQEFHFEQVTFEKLRKHPNRVAERALK